MKDYKKMAEALLSKKNRPFVLLLGAGVLLLLLSGLFSSSEGSTPASSAAEGDYSAQTNEYRLLLEAQLEEMLGRAAGVGAVSVMISLEQGPEFFYAQEYEDKVEQSGAAVEQQSEEARSNSYLTVEGEGGETPILLSQRQPEIRGVLVVCEGARDEAVRISVIGAVSTLLDLSTNRIEVIESK